MRTELPGGHRRSIRLSGHDYASSACYFVTLCTFRRRRLFGRIVDATVRLSSVGELVQQIWIATEGVRPGVVLDAFVIMPNHMHAIVILPHTPHVNSQSRRLPRSLGSLVAGFKTACTSRVNAMIGAKGIRIWQRNYHERVLRNGDALARARRYIAANPARGA